MIQTLVNAVKDIFIRTDYIYACYAIAYYANHALLNYIMGAFNAKTTLE
jgi:hypothetical protein